jgi:thioredoxin
MASEFAPAQQDAQIIREVTDASFSRDVVDQSATVPVVLDLWADWCGPCKQLTPVLERLALEYRGRLVLAKVDVDAEPRIVEAFQVQSIPSVFAVLAGQPIPLFQGALTESQIRAYLEELLRVAAENGVTGRLPGPAGLIRPISGVTNQGGAIRSPRESEAPESIPVDARTLTFFVSHATEDGPAAVDVTAELERRGASTWLATRDIQVGENYAAQIHDAIVESSHLVVLLSPASIASAHVQREVNLALDQGKALLPVVLSRDPNLMSTLPAQWKYWLGVVQVVPYSGAANAVDVLLRSIGSKT